MKLDFEPNSTARHFSVDSDVAAAKSDNSSTDVSELLQAGIKAAQEGSRAEAKTMLLQVTEAEPANENAWLWLASISEYPEELLGFLNNVLNINPDNARALEWAKATKSLLAKNFLKRGIEATKEDQNSFAKQCFLQAIASESENETAWLWLASVSESVEEKNAYLEKVLLLNPENETALNSLGLVKKQMNELQLPKAVAEAIAGEFESAVETLDEILDQSPEMEDAWLLKSFFAASFDDKIFCFDKVLEFNPDSELAQANVAFLRSMKSKLIVEENEKPEEYESSAQIFEVSEFENEEVSAESAEEEISAVSGSEVIDENIANDFDGQEEFPAPKESSDKENLLVEQISASESWAQKLEFERKLAQEENQMSPDVEKSVDENNESGNQFTEENQDETRFTVAQPEENIFEDVNSFPETGEKLDAGMDFAAQQSNEEQVAGSDEEYVAVPELDAIDEAEVSEEIAKIYAEYSTAATEEEPENSDDAELSELSSAEDNLPSYYEEENEEIFSLNPAPVSDYPQHTEESEQDLLEQDLLAEHNEPAEEKWTAQESETAVDISSKPSTEMMFACPFCKAENESQAFVCGSCQAMLSLSDLEMLLAHKDGNSEIVRHAVEKMEVEKETFEFGAEELKFLGIGHINLKNLRQGFNYLQEAVQANPNDVVLSSQVNAFAIRLAEIEQQESIHNSMPKNKKILIVDDSATVRKLISGKLEKSGHEVICAVDGMDALEKINEVVPDLILLDINMPRMDGYQVCKLIRGNDVTKDVPIVMISGKDGFFDKVRGRMAGTTGYITKPFGPETLMKTVETYIV